MSQEVADALEAWNRAPAYVKVNASPFVGPLLAALVAMDERVAKLEGGAK